MTDERERMGFEFSFNADTEDDFIRAVMAAMRGINNSYPHGVQFTRILRTGNSVKTIVYVNRSEKEARECLTQRQ